MKVILILAGLVLSILDSSANTFAQQPQAPSAGRPVEPIAKLLTMDQKVAMANHIFIGTGTRVYFIDRFYKEVAYEDAFSSTKSDSKSAIIEIEVSRNLYPQTTIHKVARFYTVSSLVPFGGEVDFDKLRVKYVGKPMIYFTNAYVENIHDFEKNRAPIVGRIPMHQFVVTLAISGPTANPLPLLEIQEVMQAVNLRIESESRAKK